VTGNSRSAAYAAVLDHVLSTPSAPRAAATAAPVEVHELRRFLAALDAHAMGPRLSAALQTRRQPCHVLDAKYEPGIRASVLYSHGNDVVRGDLATPESSASGARMTDWPGLELSVYPDDPELPTLPSALNASTMGPQLAQLTPNLPPLQRRALSRRCRVTLLRYRAGKRATLRLGTPISAVSYVAKVYHDGAKAAAVADEAQALAQIAGQGSTLRVAPIVGFLPELSVVVQQSISGQPLESLLAEAGRPSSSRQEAVATEAMQLAAAALAQLHRGPVVSTRTRSVEKELHRFRSRALRIGTVDAERGNQLLGVAERLLETFGAFPVQPPGIVHGDCKPGQFVLAGHGTVYLLDFDHCGVSDQAGDAGTFVASLRQLAVQRTVAGASPASTAGLNALAEKFLATYCEFVGDNLVTRIRWHEVVALERKALRSFARSPKSPLPTALVEESHRCLDRVTQELS
jgi:aminoglycoside phosphotransferase (APT) family kinase protein